MMFFSPRLLLDVQFILCSAGSPIDLRGGCEGDLCFSTLKENNHTKTSEKFSKKVNYHSRSERMEQTRVVKIILAS